MKLSIETYVLRERYDDETALQMIKNAGFDAFDYSFFWVSEDKDMLGEDYLDKALKLREFADSLNISCNQAHAPFDLTYKDNFDLSNLNYLRLVRSIEAAAILGAPNIIVHLIKNNLPKDFDFYGENIKFINSLLPYCQKFGIALSIENLFIRNKITRKYKPVFKTAQEHLDFVEGFNSEFVNICIDVGHLNVLNISAGDYIKKLNSKNLKALHIHDNDGREDSHLLPYSQNINFDKIAKALKEIEYNGDLTLEVPGYLESFKTEKIPLALTEAEKIGRLIIDKIK